MGVPAAALNMAQMAPKFWKEVMKDEDLLPKGSLDFFTHELSKMPAFEVGTASSEFLKPSTANLTGMNGSLFVRTFHFMLKKIADNDNKACKHACMPMHHGCSALAGMLATDLREQMVRAAEALHTSQCWVVQCAGMKDDWPSEPAARVKSWKNEEVHKALKYLHKIVFQKLFELINPFTPQEKNWDGSHCPPCACADAGFDFHPVKRGTSFVPGADVS